MLGFHLKIKMSKILSTLVTSELYETSTRAHSTGDMENPPHISGLDFIRNSGGIPDNRVPIFPESTDSWEHKDLHPPQDSITLPLWVWIAVSTACVACFVVAVLSISLLYGRYTRRHLVIHRIGKHIKRELFIHSESRKSSVCVFPPNSTAGPCIDLHASNAHIDLPASNTRTDLSASSTQIDLSASNTEDRITVVSHSKCEHDDCVARTGKEQTTDICEKTDDKLLDITDKIGIT